MDIDVFVATHRGEWARLEQLVRQARRPRSMSAADIDELVRLYQQAATQLSIVQTRSADPIVVANLSRLVAGGRAAIAGGHSFLWADVARFFLVTFPVAVYRARTWWVPTAVVSLLVALGFGWWIASHPAVQHGLVPPQEVRDLTSSQFSEYYRSAPAHTFASHVWTNNVWVAATTLIGGLALGVPTIYMLFVNMLNVGVDGGYMVAAGKSGEFFGLILPHGVLELTAVFVAAGAGLRLGWTIIEPGRRRRTDAVAAEVRAAVSIALGLIVVLGVSGAIEGFVTPSGWPTWARIGIGLVAEGGFLSYVWVLGGRAARAGETGDLDAAARGDLVSFA
ncbi:MAG TPA: stage II sporulation protein M [Mycobacteriales bacterium]|nr:stage II sporulation protein M [Mycobacteriales bacterium]